MNERHGYFVLQASALWTEGKAELRGVVEDLTTGEKQHFHSAADVGRLMASWAARGFGGSETNSNRGESGDDRTEA